MGGMEWLIPVFVVVIFLASSLLRRGEEERNNRRRTAPGGESPGGRTVRRPASDIDRFLEEVNRRRRQGGERRVATPSREPPSGSLTEPVSRSRTQTRGPAKRQPALAQPVMPPASQAERIRLAEAAFVLEALPVRAAPEPPPAPSLSKTDGSPPAAEVAAADNPLATLAQVTALLRSQENLAAAVMLHEILGPPLCRRSGVR